MTQLQSDMEQVQALTHRAYLESGGILALLDSRPIEAQRLAAALDKTAGVFEASTVELRNLCERHRPPGCNWHKKASSPRLDVAGSIALTEHGWLHITLNTLLPHCTRESPRWLTDTVTRLLDDFAASGTQLPYFREALLVLDEHCSIENRQVYDQDNKGYKAISNALKGRLFRDDDQFTLSLCLLATWAEIPACHIFVLPMSEADDYFFMRCGKYPVT